MKEGARLVAVLAGIFAIAVITAFVWQYGRGRWLVDERTNLAGEWSLTLPAGFVKSMTIEAVSETRYRLSPLNFAGTYELRDRRLEMVEPRDPRLTEFVWELDDDGTLSLIEEPPVPKTGARYSGAVLRRKEPEDPK